MDLGKAHDLTNMKFGGWTALYRCPRPQGHRWGTYWLCACECGVVTKPLTHATLTNGKSQSCGCRERPPLGTRFGKWTVSGYELRDHHTWAHCLCDCGTERDVVLASLVIGDSHSCGCLQGHENPQQAPITKILDTYKRQAKDMGRPWLLDRELVASLLTSNCHYCGAPPSNSLKSKKQYIFKYNGIDRIDNTQGYLPKNVVSCCKICNMAKHAAPYDAFLATVKRIYEHLNLEKVTFAELPSPPPSNFVVEHRRRWDHKKRKAGQEKRRFEKFPEESC